MEVICYAGGRGEHPENTMEAIAHCQKVNAEWRIEIDLQITKDGHIVLFHDENLKRVTDLNMNIRDVPLSYVQQLDAGYYFHSNRQYPYKNDPVRIPTLIEVFRKFPKTRFLLDVHTADLRAVDKIIKIVDQGNMRNNIVVVSKYDDMVKQFKVRKRAWTYGAPTKEVKRMVYGSFFHADGLFPLQSNILMIPVTYKNRKLLTDRVLQHVNRRRKKIWVWLHEGKEIITVNSKYQYMRLSKLGIDGVFTEYPQKLYTALEH